METRPYVPWDLMNSFLIDAFKGYGVPEDDAKICADVLLESDRRGIESHGCNRFKPIYIDRIVNGTLLPETKMDIVKDTPHHGGHGRQQRNGHGGQLPHDGNAD